MLRVLGRVSSINVRKVLWTCDEIGLPYDREDWGTGFRSVSDPEFLTLNPNGQIPVIVDGNGPLWESNTICRYLATKAGAHNLLPDDPAGRARVEQWMDWQATELNSAWRYVFMSLVRRDARYQDADQLAVGIAGWNETLAILDRHLDRTGGTVAGDFTLADIVLGLSIHRWLLTPIDHADLPAVQVYYQRLRARPAFQPYALDIYP